jgi:hypothetical protein
VSTAPRISPPAAPPERGGNPLADRVAALAQALRARSDDLGAFCADELDRLAQLVTFTGAVTPRQHRDRMAAMEEGRDHQLEVTAYAAGYDHGRREGRDLAFDEITLVLKRSAGIR